MTDLADRAPVVGPARPWVVKTTGCRVDYRWAGSLASFRAGVTSSTCDFCETPAVIEECPKGHYCPEATVLSLIHI